MKKVILHIGHDKTATTSIQATFKNNCKILNDYGYFYPVLEGREHHNKAFDTLFKEDLWENEELLLRYNLNHSSIAEARSNLRDRLTEELFKNNAHTFIFSGEAFADFSQSELEAIKVFFRTTLGEVAFEIFAYTRDPVSYASSSFQQSARLKTPDTNDLYFPYEEKIGRYIEAFGKSHINLYKFEDACSYPGGPVCFLLNKIGLKDETIDQMQIHNRSESISNMAVDLLIYINSQAPFAARNIKAGLRKRSDIWCFQSLPGVKYQLPENDIIDLRDKAGSHMIWLRDDFDICYSFSHESLKSCYLKFDDNYVEEMIKVLQKSNSIIRKLVYDYVRLRGSEANLDMKSKNNLLMLEAHFEDNYFLTTALSYSQIRKSIMIFNFLHRLSRFLYRPFRFIYKPLIQRHF